MFEQLTQKQRWGFAYAAQLRNAIPGAEKTDWTAEEIAAERLAQAGNDLYSDLESHKWRIAKQMFDAATQEQQDALLAQFGIPPVLSE